MPPRYLKNAGITVSLGNLKVSSRVTIFNLPAIITCPSCDLCRDKCYAHASERLYPTVLLCRQNNLLASYSDTFVARVCELVERSGNRLFRIHESGDFYSQAYADKWSAIAKRCPGVLFFCYTKSPSVRVPPIST